MSKKGLAIVTGGSRGIGRAICEQLAQDGYDIVFNYRSGEAAALETKQACEQHGARVIMLQADISKSEECQRLVAAALEAGNGAIDVLVNNAGVTKDGMLVRMKDEDLDYVLDTNLKGTFYMMREVSKVMLKKRSGRIINMSSVVGILGNAGQVNYSASKAGVIGMTKSLARELASRKVTVNAIAPGMIETDMTTAIPDAAKEAILKGIPMGTMGTPEDIANAVSFLASEKAGYITGQVLCVDGGMAI